MNDVLWYLVDEDKGQGRVKREEWALVPSTKTVPKQENTIDCGAFICMFSYFYFISQDTSLEFSQANVTNFRKRMALAIINFANNTEVKADSVEDSSSSSNDRQEIVSEGITSVLSALGFLNPGLHLMQTLFIFFKP
jgi:Ulp1 family protease